MALNEQTRFTLTINRLVFFTIAIIVMGFGVGVAYQSVLPDEEAEKKQSEDIGDLKVAIAKLTTIVEHQETNQIGLAKEINILQSRSSVMNVELQVISSNIKEIKRSGER